MSKKIFFAVFVLVVLALLAFPDVAHAKSKTVKACEAYRDWVQEEL